MNAESNNGAATTGAVVVALVACFFFFFMSRVHVVHVNILVSEDSIRRKIDCVGMGA